MAKKESKAQSPTIKAADLKKLWLVCSKCQTVFPYKTEDVGTLCGEETVEPGYIKMCMGLLQTWAETKKGTMIRLPADLKSNAKAKDAKPDEPRSWGYGTYGGGGGGYSYKSCSHGGDKVIYEHPQLGKKLFGSNAASLDEFSGKWGLIIDLAGAVPSLAPTNGFVGDFKTTERFKAPLSALTMTGKVVKSEYLRLNWTDMGVPPVGLPFWEKLWELMPETTVVCCQGGHGRTGTCLASLMIATGVDYYTAVETVRTEHCKSAIETLSQELYLHKLYIDMLDTLIEDAETSEADRKDFLADKAYALAHVPNKDSSYGMSKGEDAGKPQGKKKGLFTGNASAVSTAHTPISASSNTGGSAKSVGDAEKLGIILATVKLATMPTVGSVVNDAMPETKPGDKPNEFLVKECRDKNCPQWVCNDPEHLCWVEWDDSYTQFEFNGMPETKQ